MNKKFLYSKEFLEKLYLIDNFSADKIGKDLDFHKSIILYWLKKYNIERRPIKLFKKGHTTNLGRIKSVETRNKISISHLGKISSKEACDILGITDRKVFEELLPKYGCSISGSTKEMLERTHKALQL